MLLKRNIPSSLQSLTTLIFRFCHTHTQISPPPKNPLLYNYLINILSLPKPKALIVSNQYSYIKTLDKPQNFVNYFQSLGFLDSEIRSIIILAPQLLSADVENTLKPKLKFLQDFGISGVQLGKLISKNPYLLKCSLNERLKPCLEVLNDILVSNGKDIDDLCRILLRCGRLPGSGIALLANILYLKSWGINGSQLSKLLLSQPNIFTFSVSQFRNVVAKVIDMGFSTDSGMFIYALSNVSCISEETFVKKIGVFKEFGFSEIECMNMLRKAPQLLGASEEKLRVGLEFFIKTVGAKRSMIVNMPISLKLSMQDRVIPRYRVVQLLKAKGIMNKELKSLSLFSLSEKRFLMSYIWKYPDHADELLITYKGHPVDSSGITNYDI